ncbi:MAG: ABC transporter ATP-binding protein [Chloroflexota bacterium]|nr:ABC transporter ATP-binding protein [Chloroflexota bacterium]
MTNPLETVDLGKRYGKDWALRDCTLVIPPGSVTALIGPNGSGKSTFLRMAVGLATPSSGSIATLGLDPRDDAPQLLPRIGFVAQDRPLYARLTVDEMLEVGVRLNRVWDRPYARSRLGHLGIDCNKKVGKLSGGQQAQVALVLALAKHPELILLDEPTASLDPLARRGFLQVLMDAVATDGATVVFSSHNVPDLERVCDQLIILTHGTVRIAAELDDFLATHRLLIGPLALSADLSHVGDVVHASTTDRQITLLVRANGHLYDARWDVREAGFEELVLAYLASAGSAERDDQARRAS